MNAAILKTILEAPIRQKMALLRFLEHYGEDVTVSCGTDCSLPDGYLSVYVEKTDRVGTRYSAGISAQGEIST